ncbi:MAG: Gfo/Idh/MocA family oxidoreductase [Bdellovibrionota bacterium]
MAEKKLRGAIVGFGFISGRGHYPAYLLRNDAEIVAIADVSEGRRDVASKLNPSLRVYESVDQLFAAEQDLDFIDISTPPVYHGPIAQEALKRKLHVLCEKPLTASLPEAKELLLAAKKERRVVFPCHNYKHAPVVKMVDAVIASGEIGKAQGLTLSTYRTTHAKGVDEWKTDWRRDKKYSGGGIAMDHGSHTFYLAFNWLKEFPTAVTAKMTKQADQWDTEDNFSCVLTFPSGYATAHLTWTAGVRKVIYTIQGTQGAITIDDDEVQISTAAGTRRFTVASHWGDASHVHWFNSMFDKFVDCIRRGDFVNQELKEAYQCVQLIQRAYESSNSQSREFELDTGFSFL